MIKGILRKLRTGAPWRDLPERYGPWKTCHERLRKWTADGTWDRVLDHVIVKTTLLVGSSGCSRSIPARFGLINTLPGHAKRGCQASWVEELAIEGEGLGRSRGGLTSKIHLITESRGLLMSLVVTPGQAGDNRFRCWIRSRLAVMARAGPGAGPMG